MDFLNAESAITISSDTNSSSDSDETTISDAVIKEKERRISFQSMERKRRATSIKESDNSDSDTSGEQLAVLHTRVHMCPVLCKSIIRSNPMQNKTSANIAKL